MAELTAYQKQQFNQEGWILVKSVFLRKTARYVGDLIWSKMPFDPKARAAWPEGHMVQECLQLNPPDSVANAYYKDIVRCLVGDRVQDFRNTGWCPIKFPVNPQDPRFHRNQQWDDHGLHIDGNWFHHHLTSKEQALVGLEMLTDIEPNGGGTVIVPGSHKKVAQLLTAARPSGLEAEELSRRAREVCRGMPVIKMTGQAGDVVLMHPFLLHGSSWNRSDRVRLACNRCISLTRPMDFARADHAYSLVELAVLQEVLEAEFDAAAKQTKMAKWREWTNEDWSGDVGKRVLIRLGPGNVKRGILQRIGAAPWDLHLLLDGGIQYYRGGESHFWRPVRLL
mmetsp:Transcript_115834/g.327721  ORF Transcript_115834/g.327721 Transcript_115834/m.327721 type:complete len:338 (-) Transcript_115834:217-1230(-)|eukprot:CAMPEP_0117474270 /NCGR_PEP_ID=MMETSP0784-20121206/9198_1 /TAXON_ID=39447 /ORGANISM="" /LENGTH=337 /DNA_ID=CAMNT_0005268491 /DNA_START=94 /DNA_END=1107 /DNA_ORIENTATION=+